MASHLEEMLFEQIMLAGLPEPIREARFAPPRRWRFDFCWPDHGRWAVEVQGGSFSFGRHNRGTGFESDCEKFSEAAIQGWRILKVTGKMVQDGRALVYIKRALKSTSKESQDGTG